MHNGETWEKQNFFAKSFSMYPFQGLFYSTEFIIPVLIVLVIPVLIVLVIIESVVMPEISIIAIYLVIITIQKLIHFFSFIWKIKKTMFITKVIKELQKQ